MTEIDPFSPKKENPLATKPQPVSETSEVSITLKRAATTKAPWIIAKWPDIETAMLDLTKNKALYVDLVELVSELDDKFEAPEQSAHASSNPAAPQNRAAAPGGQVRECKHGQMTFQSGTKNGRVWKAFMCPAPKGTADQCAPQWLRD